jgi:hypothetical protein
VNCGSLVRESEPFFFRQGVEIDLVLVVPFDTKQALQSLFSEFISRDSEENTISLSRSYVRLGSDIKNYFPLHVSALVHGALFLLPQRPIESLPFG